MNKRLFPTAALVLALSACGGSPAPEAPAPEPAVFDPTGTYDVLVVAQGMELGGVMTIEGSAAEGYKGYIDTEMGGAALTNVVLDGQTMTFEIPDAGMVAEIVFEGDEFEGDMSGGMGDATIQGVKRSG